MSNLKYKDYVSQIENYEKWADENIKKCEMEALENQGVLLYIEKVNEAE